MTLRSRIGAGAHPVASSYRRTAAAWLDHDAGDSAPDALAVVPDQGCEGPSRLPDFLRNGHVVLGDFDGVHRGHVAAVAHAALQSRISRGPVVGVTYAAAAAAALFRLTDGEEKAMLLVRDGADGVVTLSGREPPDLERFVPDVLVRQLAAKSVVVTEDGLRGTQVPSAGALAEIAPRHGVVAHILPPVLDPGPISADLIRLKLAAGDVETASRLLGRFWSVEGVVRHGEKRGRQLGVPMANLALSPYVALAHGIYAVRALVGGRICDGVASFGRRPQFDNGAPLLEVHLLDLSEDLYGRPLRVEFVAFQRGEAVFPTLEDLRDQMFRDIADARTALASADRSMRSALNWIEPMATRSLVL